MTSLRTINSCSRIHAGYISCVTLVVVTVALERVRKSERGVLDGCALLRASRFMSLLSRGCVIYGFTSPFIQSAHITFVRGWLLPWWLISHRNALAKFLIRGPVKLSHPSQCIPACRYDCHSLNFQVAVISAKNHKRHRRKRQSVTANREKSQTPEVLTAKLTLPNLT